MVLVKNFEFDNAAEVKERTGGRFVCLDDVVEAHEGFFVFEVVEDCFGEGLGRDKG